MNKMKMRHAFFETKTISGQLLDTIKKTNKNDLK